MTLAESYRGRRAATLENRHLRVTVLEGGGHLAEIFDKATGVNPLWTPHWPSIEPSSYDPARHPEYGANTESSLLAGIMGHNVCLDIFGGPSAEEAAAGMPVHGEAAVVPYAVRAAADELVLTARLPLAGLEFERRVELHERTVRIREQVFNPGGVDRPIGWTQHVTLGPPFLQHGVTQLRASATRSRVFELPVGGADYLQPGAEFDWPLAPQAGGGRTDLRTCEPGGPSSGFTAHLMDGGREHGWFVAFSPDTRLAFGYVWRRADFPWLGIWEENQSRTHAPWNGRAVTRGLEFGVSPMPESRRAMVERGRLFDTPTFRWVPAGARLSVEYWAVARGADQVPETVVWPR
jgi:hypothetical protein